MISPMPFPTYPREAADVVLRGFYRLGAAAFIISFVVLTVEIRARLQASIPGGLRSTEPNLSEPLSMVMENCEYLGTMRVYGVYVNVGVNDKSLPSAIISMLQYAAAVLVVQFLAVVNSAIGVYLYAACVQNIYIVGLNIPAHLVVNVLAFVYCITLISLVAMSSSFREYYSSSLDFCAEKLATSDNEKLLESGFDGFHIFGIRLEWAMGASIFNLLVYFTGLLVRIFKSRDRAIALFSMANVPWKKRGFTFKVDKAELTIHTKARERIITEAREALERGEAVRIVRSYSLVQEADYRMQVEQMRKQLTSITQEQQFKSMQTHLSEGSGMRDTAFWGSTHTQGPPEPLRPRKASAVRPSREPDSPPPVGLVGLSGATLNDLFNVENLSDISLNQTDPALRAPESFEDQSRGSHAFTSQTWGHPNSKENKGLGVEGGVNGGSAFAANDAMFSADALYSSDNAPYAQASYLDAGGNTSNMHRYYPHGRESRGNELVASAPRFDEQSADDIWYVDNFGSNNAMLYVDPQSPDQL